MDKVVVIDKHQLDPQECSAIDFTNVSNGATITFNCKEDQQLLLSIGAPPVITDSVAIDDCGPVCVKSI